MERGDWPPFPAAKEDPHPDSELKEMHGVPTRPAGRLSNFPVTNLPYLFCSGRLIVSAKKTQVSWGEVARDMPKQLHTLIPGVPRQNLLLSRRG